MNKLSDHSGKLIAIIMATYNGENFLREQLDSIGNQIHTNWCLHITDDGSSDNTLNIINEFSQSISQSVTIHSGPRKGFAQNFLSIIRNDNVNADFYAFCDQDDIWKENKLLNSLSDIADFAEKTPTVVFSRTELINENNETIGFSPLFSKKPSLRNALIQSIGGGNTMLFNNETRNLLSAIPEDFKVISHDWITYQIVSACGGYVLYSAMPNILYRQHSSNIIGSNIGFKSLLTRFKVMLAGDMTEWNRANIKILKLFESKYSGEANELIHWFEKMRVGTFYARIYYSFRAGLYRQTTLGEFGLWLAVILKKL